MDRLKYKINLMDRFNEIEANRFPIHDYQSVMDEMEKLVGGVDNLILEYNAPKMKGKSERVVILDICHNLGFLAGLNPEKGNEFKAVRDHFLKVTRREETPPNPNWVKTEGGAKE